MAVSEERRKNGLAAPVHTHIYIIEEHIYPALTHIYIIEEYIQFPPTHIYIIEEHI